MGTGYKPECNDFEKLYERFDDETMKSRIKSTGEWYIKKALKYKNMYYIFSFINIIFPLVVTVISTGVFGDKYIQGITVGLSAGVTLAASSLTFLKCRDKWTLYRHTIEQIKKELALYWVCNKEERKECELMKVLEKYMEEEHNEWYRQSKESETNSSESKGNER